MKRIYFFKNCFILGALFAASGVILQALATHISAEILAQPQGHDFLHNAANILLWHGIALCALSSRRKFLHPLRQKVACSFMILGTIFFSTSVTLLSFKLIQHARLAPFGGILLILSWLIMASAAFGKKTTFEQQK